MMQIAAFLKGLLDEIKLQFLGGCCVEWILGQEVWHYWGEIGIINLEPLFRNIITLKALLFL